MTLSLLAAEAARATDWISAIGTLLGAVAAIAAMIVAWLVWQNQKLLSQRQLLLPLWTYMASLNAINPHKPIGPSIVKAANTLELVALCCEGGMVDANVIKRTFLTQFLLLYEQISACEIVPGLDKSGKAVLEESPATVRFYYELKRDIEENVTVREDYRGGQDTPDTPRSHSDSQSPHT